MISPSEYKQFIRRKAQEFGFLSVGFSKAERLISEETRLIDWLKNEQHGKMQYMENHFDMRLDPTILVPGTKTVISFLFNYFPEQQQNSESYKISKYAFGEDYHFVIKDKLKAFEEVVSQEIGKIEGRFFVDSAPVLEKKWAEKSGLGWIGKNTNLIHPKTGSFFFLAEWICDLSIEPDGPIRDYCGTCTRCTDACPTDALAIPYQIDAKKCISYLTIELKENIPSEFNGKLDNWMYGCDICQDVCPWNRFSKPHTEERFIPKNNLLEMSIEDWNSFESGMFSKLFKNSAVKRTKFSGLKRNIDFLGS